MAELNRAAAGIRMAAAELIEAAPIARADTLDRRSRLLDLINAHADQIPLHSAPLVGRLGALVALVEQSLQQEPDSLLSRNLQDFLDALNARHGNDRCAACARRPDLEERCRALGSWSNACPPHLCVGQMAHLLLELEHRTRSIYGRHVEAAASTVVSFSLGHVARGSEQGFIPEFHLDGSTRAVGRASAVQIVFEDRSIDLRTMRQAAYVCTHELVCHAFQGIQDDSRRNVGASCSWSEGWMDTVAWLLLEQWLNKGGLPDWLTQAPTPRSAIDECRQLHDRRYVGRQGRVMDPENVLRRRQARDACEKIYRWWSGPDFRLARYGLQKLVSFSIHLNAATLDDRQREDLIVRLVTGLLLSTGNLFDQTIVACEAYIDDARKDPFALIRKLPGGSAPIFSRVLT